MLRFTRSFQTSAFRRLAAGDAVPSALLQEGAPSKTVNLAEKTANGKYLVIGVPGAFSPGCSQRHVPEFLRDASKFQSKGIQKLFVVAVNDAFVTGAWSESILNATDNSKSSFVEFLADPSGQFSREWDVLFDASAFFGNARSKRYAAYIQDGKVTKAFVEPDATGINESAAANVESQI